jgi:hypothetical protein
MKYVRSVFSESELPEAVLRYNALVAFANEVAPKIAALCNDQKRTQNGIGKQTRNAVYALIKNTPEWMHAWVGWIAYRYTIVFNVRVSIPKQTGGCEYISREIAVATRDADKNYSTWIGVETTALEELTVEDVYGRTKTSVEIADKIQWH